MLTKEAELCTQGTQVTSFCAKPANNDNTLNATDGISLFKNHCTFIIFFHIVCVPSKLLILRMAMEEPNTEHSWKTRQLAYKKMIFILYTTKQEFVLSQNSDFTNMYVRFYTRHKNRKQRMIYETVYDIGWKHAQ